MKSSWGCKLLREREKGGAGKEKGGWEPCDADGGKSGWSVVTKGQHMAHYKSLLLLGLPKHSIAALSAAQRELGRSLLAHPGTEAPLLCPAWQEPWAVTGAGRAGTLGVPSLWLEPRAEDSEHFHTSVTAVMLHAGLVMMY